MASKPSKGDGKNRILDRRRLVYFFMGAMALVMVASVFFMRFRLAQIAKETDKQVRKYQKHYALITEAEEIDFWDSVYRAAVAEGEANDIYVEWFGQNLSGEYDKLKLLQIAIDASVDGIILAGGETPELAALIEKAASKNIPVVTVRDDCSANGKISFVGISSYNLGKAYGAKLIGLLTPNTTKVDVLMDSQKAGLSQDIVISGIQDALKAASSANPRLVIEGIPIENSGAFGSEEAIRDIFLDNEVPDIMICLSSVYTKCAFQAAVDYNKVGNLSILGFYDSDDILEAVSKNIMQATISIDTESMGRMSVQALQEYQTTGYVSNYMAVDTRMIGQYLANTILDERKQEVQ